MSDLRKDSHRRANDIDRHVAVRLKAARVQAGLSQEKAGDALGVSFQQVQKYEKGTNRIGPGRLAILAQLYGVPIAWLYAGILGVDGEKGDDLAGMFLGCRGASDLADAYLTISDPKFRDIVVQVAWAFARRAAKVEPIAEAAE